jgi:hypothetical protein
VLRLALTKLVEIVGDAAKHVSSEVRTAYPQVPWTAATLAEKLLGGAIYATQLLGAVLCLKTVNVAIGLGFGIEGLVTVHNGINHRDC